MPKKKKKKIDIRFQIPTNRYLVVFLISDRDWRDKRGECISRRKREAFQINRNRRFCELPLPLTPFRRAPRRRRAAKMCSRLLLVLLCIAKCVGVVLAVCTVSKHEGESGDRIQCQNATLADLKNATSSNVLAAMIFRSVLREIPRGAFTKFSTSLRSLNIHQCRIRDIHEDAFSGLGNLRKLSLPNNNISVVKEAWFRDTVYLEQLDLSYNQITSLNPSIFSRMLLLKRLDVRQNRLTCFDYARLPGGIDKVYFFGNPLTFQCRGKLTLWMRDHGVSYATETGEKERAWLDKLLWLCAIDDPAVARSELSIKECVLFNLFGQLRTGLLTAETAPLQNQCISEIGNMVNCVGHTADKDRRSTNARVISDLILYLLRAKSA
ncbi:uncharacterized protein LOC143216978 [Lasioglossum baleicum]|uniref:uncharacterized protein LOC143216978 n=1 Tax=Lasioglossum baleicum TaxID=434251 RepID=UPI003FCC4859